MGKDVKVGKNVAVVGGGNVALDVALTARRLGGEKIDLFCLESREEMPAHPWELALAEEEGIFINNLWAPKKILGDDKVAGLGLMRCTSVFDNQCNFNPVYDEEITHKVPADNVILAVGQAVVLDFVKDDSSIDTRGNRIHTNEGSLATAREGVFAGGDVVSGPASIISGIAHGRIAAIEIDKYLGGSGDISEILAEPEEEVLLPELSLAVEPRRNMPHLKVWERALGFEQVEQPLTVQQIKDEAARCLSCDARKFEVALKTESCKECGYCVEVCSVGTFAPAEGFNQKGYRPMEVKSSDYCVGCLKCFFSCPDFAIDVRDATGRK
jgi:NAD-dependent dihydropyrimidine dehydrogenase PreA subunit